MKVWMKVCAFLLLLGMSGLNSYAADDDIIEFLGDRYVIRVDKMNPDSEMTLLDVLNTCPEYLSIHGKKIDQVYTLRIDNIDLYVDGETFLANVKAREIDYIQITNNSSVAKSVAGTKGVIDVYYRQDIKTDGKVSLSGSTYGNGMAYADIKGSTEKLTVQAYALARSSYGKSYPLDVTTLVSSTPDQITDVISAWSCLTPILSETMPFSLQRLEPTTRTTPIITLALATAFPMAS